MANMVFCKMYFEKILSSKKIENILFECLNLITAVLSRNKYAHVLQVFTVNMPLVAILKISFSPNAYVIHKNKNFSGE